jgi:hypothetical protein
VVPVLQLGPVAPLVHVKHPRRLTSLS